MKRGSRRYCSSAGSLCFKCFLPDLQALTALSHVINNFMCFSKLKSCFNVHFVSRPHLHVDIRLQTLSSTDTTFRKGFVILRLGLSICLRTLRQYLKLALLKLKDTFRSVAFKQKKGFYFLPPSESSL